MLSLGLFYVVNPAGWLLKLLNAVRGPAWTYRQWQHRLLVHSNLWACVDSNHGPLHYQCSALTT